MSSARSQRSDEPDRSRDLDALLREGAWLRRLAGGLLRDPAAADDLAQDVLVAAISRRPRLSGARLRGWLASVARRIAGRSRERARIQTEAEAELARADAADRDALRRLDLHRRVAAAILALEPPYRTAILLRYLEGLPSHAIAARLGIAEAAARKRVSRGLARLREALDASDDEHGSAWTIVAASLLREPFGIATPAPESSLLPLAPIAAAMTSKLALSLLAVLAAVAAVLVVRREVAPAARHDLDSARAAHGALEPDGTEVDADDISEAVVPTGRTAVAVANERASAAPPAPRLRVVAGDGAPPDGAAAAWVDATSGVHVLALDDDGSAPLPEVAPAAGRTRVAAGAPAFLPSWAEIDPSGGDVVLTLERSVALRGRVVEDGGAPLRPLDLRVYSRDDGIGVDSASSGLRNALADAGVVPNVVYGIARAWTAADGSFELEGFRRGEQVRVNLPSTHEPVPGAASTAIAGEPAVLEVTRLPSVRGRLLWDDDGTPVRGTVYASFEDGGGYGSTTFQVTDDEGRFEIGVAVPDEDLALPPGERRILYAGLRFGVGGTGGRAALDEEREVALTADRLPIDLGEIRVRGARSLAVRVVDEEDAPVAGAAVASSVGATSTDADGLARVDVGPDDELRALAPGFALRTVDLSPMPDAEPLTVRLAPGTSLVLRTDALEQERGLKVRVAWERTPFEGAPADRPIPWDLHRELIGSVPSAMWSHEIDGMPGYVDFPIPAEGPVVVAGLRPGSALTVSLLDALQEPLDEHAVVLLDVPGQRVFELRPEDGAELCVRVLDAAGEPIPHASILLRRSEGRRGHSFAAADGVVRVRPLEEGAYDVEARARGFLPRTVARHELRAGAEPHEVRLERARSLTVRVVDDDDRPIAVGSARLRAADGWHGSVRLASSGSGKVDAPNAPLELDVVLGTRTYRETVDAAATEAVLRVPRHARVRFELDRIPALRGEAGDVVLHVREAGGDGEELRLSISFRHDARGPLAVEAELLPGAYDLDAELEEWIEALDATATRPLERRRVVVDGDATVLVRGGD